MKSLRPYQEAGIERLLREPQRRHVFAYAMGAGKSLAALAAMKEAGCERPLIVTPAMNRGNFVHEAREVYGDRVGAILWGRARKLTKKQEIARTEAYKAPVRVVSEELLAEIAGGYDSLIIDEADSLRNPQSQYSRLIREKLLPGMPALELTGTLIPNEVWQLWNPIDSLWPNWYGKPSRTKDVPWKFKEDFCNKVENAYAASGFAFKGGRNLDKLRALLKGKVHEVTDEEFARYKPPLFVSALYLDEPPSKMPVSKVIEQWAAQQTVSHVGVFCHLNESREKYAQLTYGREVVAIDATMTAERRGALLKHAMRLDRACIVATMHVLKRGVSLSFLKAALVAEWTSEMDLTTQFIGRFGRQDSETFDPTYVQFVVRPTDEQRAQLLSERLVTKRGLLAENSADVAAAKVFQRREYTDEEYIQMAALALKSYRNDDWELEDAG